MEASVAPSASALTAALVREEEKLLACVHCGFCLSACPTYTRLGDEADSPRGRLYLMRAVTEGRLAADADAFAVHIDRCLGCRMCETVCPSGVQYGWLLEQARAVIARSRGVSWMTRLLLLAFASPRLSAIGMAKSRMFRALGLPRLLVRVLPARFVRVRFGLAMLAATSPRLPRLLPSVGIPGASPATAGELTVNAPERLAEERARGADVAWGEEELEQAGSSAGQAGGDPYSTVRRPPVAETKARRVAMLTGCVQQGLFGRVNRATREVLEANGCELVDAPGQVCCGALHAHAGDRDKARDLARANIAAFDAAEVDAVVVNAAGCGAVMKEYGELLADDPAWAERAEALAARVRDVQEFLAAIELRPGGPLPLRVTYDAPCHLHHAQRVTDAPVRLLRSIPGLELVPLPGSEECCGGAGIYGILHPELGGRILDDKVASIRSTGADVVVTPNPGCMMQIGAGLLLAGEPVEVAHPIELLAESYRRRESR